MEQILSRDLVIGAALLLAFGALGLVGKIVRMALEHVRISEERRDSRPPKPPPRKSRP